MRIVNALDLHLLGRRLMKIGEGAMRGTDAPAIPSGLRLIVTDIAENAGSSIGEIAARTGLPQSYVSTSVARLRDRTAVETAGDPKDGRRTLVRLTESIPARAARRGAASIDGAIVQEAGPGRPGRRRCGARDAACRPAPSAEGVSPMSAAVVSVHGLRKRYGNREVVRSVDLEIGRGEGHDRTFQTLLPSRHDWIAAVLTRSLEQRELRYDLPLQDVEIERDEGEPAGLAHDLSLRCDLGRDENPATRLVGRVEVDPLAVAGELLDVRRDGARPLYLHDDRPPLRVAAEEVDRAGVGVPLPLDDDQARLDRLGRPLEQPVDLELGVLPLEHGVVVELVAGVLVHLLDHDHERLVGRCPVDADDVALLLHRRWSRHVVEGLVAPLGVDTQRAVVLEQDHPVAGTKPGRGATVVGDLAARDEDPHGATRLASS